MPDAVTVIVPTYREALNIPHLVGRLAALRDSSLPDLTLLLVDDDSPDATPAVVERLNAPWVTLHTRRGERGLASAVLAGLRLAPPGIAVVMDADLSHPPEAIPALIRALQDGADFALASRYVPGGSTDPAWGLRRRLMSRAAGWLARPLCRAKDPLSGFFALRTDLPARAPSLSPLGYKIGLEIMVRCRVRRPAEVPIHFADRRLGQSKLTLAEQFRFLRHLARLWRFRLGLDATRRVPVC